MEISCGGSQRRAPSGSNWTSPGSFSTPRLKPCAPWIRRALEWFRADQRGWVHGYGSRCVKPPVLYGHISRRDAMTVEWSRFAQSLTSKPVKWMVTGLVTMLYWSFVRDDQPRHLTCQQLALAMREEIANLEAAGIRVVQIDEPRFAKVYRFDIRAARTSQVGGRSLPARLPGRAGHHTDRTHRCCSDFTDIIEATVDMVADVLAIEGTRWGMRILEPFTRCRYPREVGPRVSRIEPVSRLAS